MRKRYTIPVLSLTLFLLIFYFFTSTNYLGKTKPKDNPNPSVSCNALDLSGEIDFSADYAFFEEEKVRIPKLAYENREEKVLGVANEEKWIEVDLSEQKLRAWEGNTLFLETLISSGLPWTPTPFGEFRIWIKLRATKMEGGSGKYYYYLPNVPYVMYFSNSEVPSWRGYGLHGTYWHNSFGTQRSHGCVNLPTEMAKVLYYWTSPILPEGKSSVYSSPENPGTRIVIHE